VVIKLKNIKRTYCVGVKEKNGKERKKIIHGIKNNSEGNRERGGGISTNKNCYGGQTNRINSLKKSRLLYLKWERNQKCTVLRLGKCLTATVREETHKKIRPTLFRDKGEKKGLG